MRALIARAVLVPTLVGALVLSVLLISAPAQAQRIRADFWGMHDSNWTTAPQVDVGAANLTTSAVSWHQVEKSRGVYDFSRLDEQVTAAEAAGAKPVLVLGGTPKFHSTRSKGRTYADPPRMKPWKKYVGKVVKKYGNRLDYMIWPEPNIVENWNGSMKQMAKVSAAASRKVHSAAPKAKVVGPAMTLRRKSQRKAMLSFYRQKVDGKRIHTFLDAVAIDPFPALRGKPEDSLRLMVRAKKDLRGIGVRLPLWNNEINYGVQGGFEDTPVKYSWAKQKSYVIRTFALSAEAGMKRTYWLGWFNTTRMGIDMTLPDGTPAPPSQAYSLIQSWIGGSRFAGCEVAKKTGVWTCTARKSGEVRRIYWKPKGKATVRLAASRSRLEDQNGVVDTSPRRKVTVTYKPIMVASAR